MALGKPKSTSLKAIEKRWSGFVKRQPRREDSDLPSRDSWIPVLWDDKRLPSAQQAALDIDALLSIIRRSDAVARDNAALVAAAQEAAYILGPHYDCGCW